MGSGFCKKIVIGGGCLIRGGGHDIGCIPCSKAQKIKKLRNNNWESIIKLAHFKKCFSFYFQKSLKISKTAISPPPPPFYNICLIFYLPQTKFFVLSLYSLVLLAAIKQ